MQNTVVVIDDDRSARLLIESSLRSQPEIKVVCFATGEDALRNLEALKPTVALLDIYLPGLNGLELFKKVKALDSRLPVIFITGDTSSQTAIEAMRAGAFDYISKPFKLDQLRSLVNSAISSRRLMDEPVALHVNEQNASGEQFIGRSMAMLDVFKQIGRVAAQSVTVLVRGESGCGKELVARALVQHSERSEKHYMAVNCAALPDQLLESELFGHEKGAFTGAEKRRIGKFEQCDDGTIFLDEIGDMTPLVQGKVLRLLQEQKFERVGGNDEITTNVRILAATNRPLEHMVERGEFREDLLYRLNGFTIQLPPLRDRREDIPLLLEYFLRRAREEMKKPNLSGIAPAALDLLVSYGWPGNVRQLQSVVRQAVLACTGTVISPPTLPDFVRSTQVIVRGYDPESNEAFPADRIARPTASNSATTAVDVDTATSSLDAVVNDSPANGQTLTANASLQHESFERSEMRAEFSNSNGQQSRRDLDAVDSNGFDAQIETVDDDPSLLSAIRSIDRFIEERLSENSDNLYSETVDLVERYLFSRVLEHTGGNQSKTAEILGITRGKVRDRIAAFDIDIDKAGALL